MVAVSKQPRLYAFVKDILTGEVKRVEIKPSTNTSKLERRMIKDLESGLWLYKSRYEYQDQKNKESS